jgi:SAM-dependent methyltransferase
MTEKVYRKLKAEGVSGLVSAVYRRALPRRLTGYKDMIPFFAEKRGLEIGGPSEIFGDRGLIPVYAVAATIDNCNFSTRTIWEGDITEGDTFCFHKRRAPGRQYVLEASHLSDIPSTSYDFLLSSHTLEHVANALQALEEWVRVLKADGLLLLVVPHKDGNFDHLRPVTSLVHLVEDFEKGTSEDDLTHLEEILELHDLSRDPWAGEFDAFRQRSMRNSENRSLHHHVFDTRLVIEILHHMGLQIILVEAVKPVHIVAIAQKPRAGKEVRNDPFKGTDTRPCWSSPFPSDQLPRGQIRRWGSLQRSLSPASGGIDGSEDQLLLGFDRGSSAFGLDDPVAATPLGAGSNRIVPVA